MLLETFTAQDSSDLNLPDFLTVEREVTHDPSYSMFNLSLRVEYYDEHRCSVISTPSLLTNGVHGKKLESSSSLENYDKNLEKSSSKDDKEDSRK